MNPICTIPGAFTLSNADAHREEQIQKLLSPLFIEEGDIDKAFELAKGAESTVVLHFQLSDVCRTYLRLGTHSGCEKAYQVVLYKEKHKDFISGLLDSIIEACIQVKTKDSIALAGAIFRDHEKYLKYSLNRNDYQVAKAQLEHIYGEIQPAKKRTADEPEVKRVQPAIAQPTEEATPVQQEAVATKFFEDASALQEHLKLMDQEQKTKYFASTLKFASSWARGEEEMTPLQYACQLGSMDCVQLLVQQGAPVNDCRNTSDSTQRGSIHFALDANHPEIALYLHSQGAEDRLASCDNIHGFSKYQLPAEYGGSWTCLTALHMAIIKKYHALVQALSGENNLKVRASGGLTTLHLAASSGDEQMVALLLSNGAKG